MATHMHEFLSAGNKLTLTKFFTKLFELIRLFEKSICRCQGSRVYQNSVASQQLLLSTHSTSWETHQRRHQFGNLLLVFYV